MANCPGTATSSLYHVPLHAIDMCHEPANHCKIVTCVRVEGHDTASLVVLRLLGRWSETLVSPGDLLHVIPMVQNVELPTSGESSIVIGDTIPSKWAILVHPEVLISATFVASAGECIRRQVLRLRYSALETICSKATVKGTLLHEVMQAALTANHFDSSSLSEFAEAACRLLVDDMYSVGLSTNEAMNYVSKFFMAMKVWADQFISPSVKEVEIIPHRQLMEISINRVVDIEDTLWSARFGIKGKVDASLRIRGNSQTLALELKSGKSKHIWHLAQLQLYNLMLEQPHGLLAYMQLDREVATMTLQVVQSDIKHLEFLVQTRNELAYHWANSTSPPMLVEPGTCKRCFSKEICRLYETAYPASEIVENAGPILETPYQLSPVEIKYIRDWESFVDLEFSSETNSFWTYTPEEGEKRDLCIAGLSITSEVEHTQGSFSYTFKHASGSKFHKACFTVGDSVSVCDQAEMVTLHVALGTVRMIDDEQIEVSVSQQLFRTTTYRVDIYRSQSISGKLRSYIMKLFYNGHKEADSARFRQLRRLLVTMDVSPSFPLFEWESALSPSLLQTIQFLNPQQRHALQKSVCSRELSLIMGFPGSGKSEVIVCLIRVLVELGQRVIVASHTNAAVDNILVKLLNAGFPADNTLRVGRLGGVDPRLAHLMVQNAPDTDTLSGLLSGRKVVGATCYGAHLLEPLGPFDVCIVDEAGQVLEPLMLGVLQHANRPVLVGDHYQLPPLIREKHASDTVYSSLFKRLSERYPRASFSLSSQYRMNKDILALSNHAVYNNAMSCATSTIAEQKFIMPRLFTGGLPWVQRVLDPTYSVSFIDTSCVSGISEQSVNSSRCNEVEAQVVLRVWENMKSCGVLQDSVGIISPYRAQLDLVRGLISGPDSPEINTVDRYQGRDKDCIILSLVRVGKDPVGILTDWRRINVAITRAKRKLIIIGHSDSLRSLPVIADILEQCRTNNWIVSLPRDSGILIGTKRKLDSIDQTTTVDMY